ncbi:hypothetical protein CC86DRAFT_368584 [Ophiobolus disseminans]|uniref:Extracellular membrane protein CFEM domain-containing protein n=1 Tax=Ophiobolus disseminans TaxID=1469910 RepID=A0A6A7A4T7_9PLEO|nr:hypothetical protein CC86DRAFT_368584 [Ophiobolus disseminans]
MKLFTTILVLCAAAFVAANGRPGGPNSGPCVACSTPGDHCATVGSGEKVKIACQGGCMSVIERGAQVACE